MHGSVSPVRRSGAELVFQLFKEPVGLFIGRTRVRRDGVISGRLAKLREKLCAGGVPELRIQLRNAVITRISSSTPVTFSSNSTFALLALYETDASVTPGAFFSAVSIFWAHMGQTSSSIWIVFFIFFSSFQLPAGSADA